MPRSPRRFRNRRRTAVRTIAAALLAAALLASASAGGSRAAAQETGGCFGPRPLPGLTIAAFAGGGHADLERCATAFDSRVHAVGGDGGWLTLDPAADDDANAAFRARYAGGVPAGSLFLLERETPLGLVVREPESFEGYTLFDVPGERPTYLIDHEGRIAHTWARGAGIPRLLEDGRVQDLGNRAIVDIGPGGDVLRETRYGGDGDLHHDFLELPDGNLLLLVRHTATPEEAVAAGADPAFVPAGGIEYETLVEVRPGCAEGDCTGEIVWEWSLWDHLIQDFDPGKPNYGAVADHPGRVDINFFLADLAREAAAGRLPRPEDWIHANSIDYHPALDRIVISARNYSELWIVDHSTTTEEAAGSSGGDGGRGGDLLYRWGNPRAYRAGTAEDQQLFYPHDIHWIAPGLPGAGNILAFNNGYETAEHERGWSSVVEVALPEDGSGYRPGEPAPVWTYEADPPSAFYSRILSGAQRLPNGNTLICSGVQGAIFEVTPDGRTVWKYVNPHSVRGRQLGGGRLTQGDRIHVLDTGPRERWENYLYRATRYAPDHPGLRGLDLTPKGTIERYPEP